jgi:hypothetical protein
MEKWRNEGFNSARRLCPLLTLILPATAGVSAVACIPAFSGVSNPAGNLQVLAFQLLLLLLKSLPLLASLLVMEHLSILASLLLLAFLLLLASLPPLMSSPAHARILAVANISAVVDVPAFAGVSAFADVPRDAGTLLLRVSLHLLASGILAFIML